MERLTRDQEVFILKELIANGVEIGNGAARTVYESTEAIEDLLNIHEPFVIKVVMGLGGFNQTALEVATYERYGADYALAKIFAAGQFVEIMEEIDPVSEDLRDYTNCGLNELFLHMNYTDSGDVADARNEKYIDEDPIDWRDVEYDYSPRDLEQLMVDCDFDIHCTAEELDNMLDVVYSLEDIFGETGDNGQIGYNRDGDLVAYDYGFDTDTDNVQTSNISFKSDQFIGAYLSELCEEYEQNEHFNPFCFFDRWEDMRDPVYDEFVHSDSSSCLDGELDDDDDNKTPSFQDWKRGETDECEVEDLFDDDDEEPWTGDNPIGRANDPEPEIDIEIPEEQELPF